MLNRAGIPAASAEAAENLESRPPVSAMFSGSPARVARSVTSPTPCSAATLAEDLKVTRLGSTRHLKDSVSMRSGLSPSFAPIRMTIPAPILTARRIGVIEPRNHPQAAKACHAPWSGSGRTPANKGRAPRRFDQTMPPGNDIS